MRIESSLMTPPPPPGAAVAAAPARSTRMAAPTDLIVLSAAAYRALVSAPRGPAELAGTYDVNVANASGRVSVAPSSMDGVVTVSIDLFHVPVWPDPPGPIRQLHLTAQLRGSWVARVASDDSSSAEQAQQLAQAVAKLAQIPGQQTVVVQAEK